MHRSPLNKAATLPLFTLSSVRLMEIPTYEYKDHQISASMPDAAADDPMWTFTFDGTPYVGIVNATPGETADSVTSILEQWADVVIATL
jgi:hypothetical protein